MEACIDLLQDFKGDDASFQTKLRSKLRQAIAEHIFPQLEKLKIEILFPADLFAVVFTSISLSLAEIRLPVAEIPRC